MQDELQKTVNNIAESYKIKVTAKDDKPVAFEPFDLTNSESFLQDWKSINRIMAFVSYVRNHHPALFEEAYEAGLKNDR